MSGVDVETEIFLARVMARVPEMYDLSKYEPEMGERFRNMVRDKKSAGWSEDDVVAYVRCFEDIDPALDEETALARMAQIKVKYA